MGRLLPSRLARIFLTGLLAVLPLAATLALLVLAVQFLASWLGPSSLFGRLVRSLGFGVSGSEWVSYLLGLLLLGGLIFALGLAVERGFQLGLAGLVHRLVMRVPVVSTVYDVLKKLIEMFSKREGDGLNSMSAVWVRFGEAPATQVLALLSTREPVLVNGQACYGVIVPTAPVPVGGGLLYVPVEAVTPADIGVEAVTSIYVSMGVTSSQYLPKA